MAHRSYRVRLKRVKEGGFCSSSLARMFAGFSSELDRNGRQKERTVVTSHT